VVDATGSPFICHFPFTIGHFKSVHLSLCARVNGTLTCTVAVSNNGKMRNAKWKMKNNPVAAAHGSEI